MTCALDVCDGAEAPPARRRYWFADKMISRRFAFIKIVWLTSVPPPRPAPLSARSLALPQHSTLPEQQHGALSEQETLHHKKHCTTRNTAPQETLHLPSSCTPASVSSTLCPLLLIPLSSLGLCEKRKRDKTTRPCVEYMTEEERE